MAVAIDHVLPPKIVQTWVRVVRINRIAKNWEETRDLWVLLYPWLAYLESKRYQSGISGPGYPLKGLDKHWPPTAPHMRFAQRRNVFLLALSILFPLVYFSISQSNPGRLLASHHFCWISNLPQRTKDAAGNEALSKEYSLCV